MALSEQAMFLLNKLDGTADAETEAVRGVVRRVDGQEDRLDDSHMEQIEDWREARISKMHDRKAPQTEIDACNKRYDDRLARFQSQ